MLEIARDKEWLTITDVRNRLHISRGLAIKLIRTGELPAHRFGNVYRIHRDNLELYINSQRVVISQPN